MAEALAALNAPQRELSGIEKSAILLMVLGEQDASQVLQHMSPEELQQLGEAMTSLSDITQHEIHNVMLSFSDDTKSTTPLDIGAYDYLKKVLKTALGNNKAKNILSRIVLGPDAKGIEVLKWMNADTISDFIKDEHPQIVATLLTQLDSELAGKVLESLDLKMQSKVIERIALMEDVNSEALKELDELIEDYFKKDKPDKVPSVGGPSIAASILNNVNTSIESKVMEQINSRDKQLGEKIKSLMFVFDNLLDVDDRGMQTILRESPQDKLVLALKGASADVREKIFKNMSKRASEMLRDDLETAGPAKLSDVEDAQKEILEVALKLAEDGKIMLGGGDDDYL
tara:strand:- start:512 stop:1540 length:1029 start_codon:yes stop_codon:yes gene_type:complete